MVIFYTWLWQVGDITLSSRLSDKRTVSLHHLLCLRPNSEANPASVTQHTRSKCWGRKWLVALEKARKRKRARFVHGRTMTKTKANVWKYYSVIKLNGMVQNKCKFSITIFCTSEIMTITQDCETTKFKIFKSSFFEWFKRTEKNSVLIKPTLPMRWLNHILTQIWELF